MIVAVETLLGSACWLVKQNSDWIEEFTEKSSASKICPFVSRC